MSQFQSLSLSLATRSYKRKWTKHLLMECLPLRQTTQHEKSLTPPTPFSPKATCRTSGREWFISQPHSRHDWLLRCITMRDNSLNQALSARVQISVADQPTWVTLLLHHYYSEGNFFQLLVYNNCLQVSLQHGLYAITTLVVYPIHVLVFPFCKIYENWPNIHDFIT